ncbi:MAG TPA: DNA helicase RecQ [Cyclobacteriaceae bacterium]
MIEAKEELLKSKLKEIFGYTYFRGNQEAIINNVLNGKNTFVIMPTGAGKSLCYQLPALLMEGTAIVISPLIALMKNQVDQMNSFGVNARFMNSTLSKSEINHVKKETVKGNIKLLYVAPESLSKVENVNFLKQANISFVAIDEAHCISEWGHDFRPEYRKIKSIVTEIGDVPLIALTATATPKVQMDIQRNLRMENAEVFKSSFNRTNLYYEVRPKVNAKKQLIKFIKDNQGKSGIVYCLSRKKVEEIAQFLQVNNIKAAPYHAGIDGSTRIKNQDDFLNEEIDVIVATIAFGMGIDKPDVRFVVHYDTPKSLEGYYQETGRSGRDGLEGICILFYSYNDILKLEKFNKDKSVTERENARILLEEMASYAESSVCRRKQLLHYFGEAYDLAQCMESGKCDNCSYTREKYDGRDYISTVLKTVELTSERFDLTHLVKIIRGSKDQYVLSYDHNKLEVYGKGSNEEDNFWRSVIRQTMLNEFLKKDIENIGVLKLTDNGKHFIKSPYPVEFIKDLDFEINGEEEGTESFGQAPKGHDQVLFDLLKSLRKKVAKQKDLPPYVIFQDPSLEEMATIYPTTNDELIKINGIGETKAIKFGKPFLDLIARYVDENDILKASDVLVKSSGARSKNKIFIIQQVDKKIDLDEISEAKNLKFEELLDEIENICFGGTKLNIDYYIDQILDDEKQDDIYDYFLSTDSDDLDLAMEELGDDYTEEEVRLMRIKFMSEYAH